AALPTVVAEPELARAPGVVHGRRRLCRPSSQSPSLRGRQKESCMAVEDADIQGEGGATESVPPVAHPIEERLDQLEKLREQALEAGSPGAVERQHKRGKLLARERLEQLLDPGSFVELDMLARHRAHGFGIEANRPLTDGVVTGWGTVNGRKVFVFA